MKRYETYHLPVVLHLSKDRLLPPHALIPARDRLRVVGHSAVLVFDGTVAHVQQPVTLLFFSRRKHITCSLEAEKHTHTLFIAVPQAEGRIVVFYCKEN